MNARKTSRVGKTLILWDDSMSINEGTSPHGVISRASESSQTPLLQGGHAVGLELPHKSSILGTELRKMLISLPEMKQTVDPLLGLNCRKTNTHDRQPICYNSKLIHTLARYVFRLLRCSMNKPDLFLRQNDITATLT